MADRTVAAPRINAATLTDRVFRAVRRPLVHVDRVEVAPEAMRGVRESPLGERVGLEEIAVLVVDSRDRHALPRQQRQPARQRNERGQGERGARAARHAPRDVLYANERRRSDLRKRDRPDCGETEEQRFEVFHGSPNRQRKGATASNRRKEIRPCPSERMPSENRCSSARTLPPAVPTGIQMAKRCIRSSTGGDVGLRVESHFAFGMCFANA
jgi:hypothetical protein